MTTKEEKYSLVQDKKQKVKYSWKCISLGFPERELQKTTFEDCKSILQTFPKDIKISRK